MALDVSPLCPILPVPVFNWLMEQPLDSAIDLIFDTNRPVRLRSRSGSIESNYCVTPELLDSIAHKLDGLTKYNRTGIPDTLFRVSAILSKQGEITGLTIRLARQLDDAYKAVDGFLDSNLLIIGKPGMGKTTLLRSITQQLSNSGKEVIIVDKSDEIAGFNDFPHKSVGKARRMSVRNRQFETMLEAVENHMPDVIVVDEIRDRDEALAAQSIVERGVRLIATAHGESLGSILRNPAINYALGNVKTVTISDEQMIREELDSKIKPQREFPSAFNTAVVIHSQNEMSVYENLEECIDALLQNKQIEPTVRYMSPDGKWETIKEQVIHWDNA